MKREELHIPFFTYLCICYAKRKRITILGIESSCDDTSAAVIRDEIILSNVIANRSVHERYGGVVPELASRAHQQNIIPVVRCTETSRVSKDELSAIALLVDPGCWVHCWWERPLQGFFGIEHSSD